MDGFCHFEVILNVLMYNDSTIFIKNKRKGKYKAQLWHPKRKKRENVYKEETRIKHHQTNRQGTKKSSRSKRKGGGEKRRVLPSLWIDVTLMDWTQKSKYIYIRVQSWVGAGIEPNFGQFVNICQPGCPTRPHTFPARDPFIILSLNFDIWFIQ